MPENNAGKPELHSFEEAWPYYLSQHSNPGTRRRHALATAFGIVAGLPATITAGTLVGIEAAAAVLTASVIGTVAQLLHSHKTIEGNKAAFINKEGLKHPEQIWWGVKSDFKMSWMTLKDMVFKTDDMVQEFKRLGVDHTGKGTKSGPQPG